MCITLGTGLALAGMGLSAAGAIGQGVAQSNAAAYQAQVARNNAQLALYNAQVNRNNAIAAEQAADRAIAAGQQKAEAASKQAAIRLAKIKAGQAASNIDVNTGSALDVQVGSREYGYLDTETTLNDAQLKAYGYRSQARDFRSKADLDEFGARTGYAASEFASSRVTPALVGGFLSAGGTLASSASQVNWGKLFGAGSGDFGTSGAAAP